MIHYITSKANQRIKDLMRLKDNKTRNEKGLFIIEGYHLLEVALKHQQVDIIVADHPFNDIDEQIEQIIVSKEIVQKLSSQVNSQGVLAICHYPKENKYFGKRVLYLEAINDPGNVGTILRIAAAFGFSNVVLADNCCSPYNEKAINASQGALFEVNIVQGNRELLKNLKKQGYQVVATDVHHGVALSKAQFQEKCVVILGNEARGVTFETFELSSLRVTIPMQNIESLNVAVAAGIICYQIVNG